MGIWIAKAVIQKTISFFPFKHRVNFLFQKYITKGVRLTDALFEDKLTHCCNHLRYYAQYGNGTKGSSLEIGTGWYPIVPLGLYLAGFEKIYSIDISDLLSTPALHETIRRYQTYQADGRLQKYLPAIQPERLAKLGELVNKEGDVKELLKQLGIEAITGDARHMPFADNYFDLINSNNTFEHIYPDILIPILRDFNRVLKADGLMSHQIDMSDHFAHLDKSITVYNFLRYSDSTWALIDNSIQPQNRLRLPTYRSLLSQTGFTILTELNNPGSTQQLSTVPLDDQYNTNTAAENAVVHSLIIAKK